MSTRDAAFDKIKAALDLTSPGLSQKVTMETHLVEEDILDSLDLMNFMFELEELHGSKIEEISETFDDYRVATLVGFMASA
jgi:acyl carrier protein